jgi:neutral amino acid transport system permease protein
VVDFLARPALDTILLGSLYTMMALGLTLTYKVTKIPNFAHAEYVTVGAYTSVVVIDRLSFSSLAGVVAVIASFLASAGVALVVDELVFKPLFRRGASTLHMLVASIGAGLVLRYIVFIGADLGDLLSAKASISAETLWVIGNGSVSTLHVTIVPTVAGIVIVLHMLFVGTRVGKGMRAMASNFDLSQVSGINTTFIRRLIWILAGGLAGVAGAFWAIYNPVTPELGWRSLLWIFAASILAGLTSFYGTIAGGYTVAAAENFGISLLNRAYGVDVAYKPLIILAIIVAVFLIRPTGFAGLTAGDILTGLRSLPSRFLKQIRRIRASGG